jgi:hypothetical protein
MADGSYLETYEHRVTNGVVTTAEHVHHRNRQRDDNRRSNLRPLSAAEHKAEHGKEARARAAQVVRLYAEGLTSTAIGRRVKLDPSRVVRILQAAAVTARTTSDYAGPIDQADVLARYQAGQGYSRIGHDLGVSLDRVKAVIVSSGVKTRGPGRVPSGVPPATRRAVRERDQDHCVRCGAQALTGPNSIHHRRPRGMGGTRDPRTHALSNLVLLCGSATTGCHGWIESNRAEAVALGWLISNFEVADPQDIPLRCGDPIDRHVHLHDDGTKTSTDITFSRQQETR